VGTNCHPAASAPNLHCKRIPYRTVKTNQPLHVIYSVMLHFYSFYSLTWPKDRKTHIPALGLAGVQKRIAPPVIPAADAFPSLQCCCGAATIPACSSAHAPRPPYACRIHGVPPWGPSLVTGSGQVRITVYQCTTYQCIISHQGHHIGQESAEIRARLLCLPNMQSARAVQKIFPDEVKWAL